MIVVSESAIAAFRPRLSDGLGDEQVVHIGGRLKIRPQRGTTATLMGHSIQPPWGTPGTSQAPEALVDTRVMISVQGLHSVHISG